MAKQEELINSVLDLSQFLKTKYHLSTIDAKKVAMIMAQLKLGYILNIYISDSISDIIEGQTCTIEYNHNDIADITFISVVENDIKSVLLKGEPERVMRVLSLEEFVATCIAMLPDKHLTLSMDFKWNDIV